MNKKSQGISIFVMAIIVVLISIMGLTIIMNIYVPREGRRVIVCNYLRPEIMNPKSSYIDVEDTYVIGEPVSIKIIFNYNYFTSKNCTVDGTVNINLDDKTHNVNISEEKEINLSLDTNIDKAEDVKTLKILWSELYISEYQNFVEEKEMKKPFHIISKLKAKEYQQAQEQINATSKSTSAINRNTKWIIISSIVIIIIFIMGIIIKKKKKPSTEEERRKFLKKWKI